eukprot:36203_1
MAEQMATSIQQEHTHNTADSCFDNDYSIDDFKAMDINKVFSNQDYCKQNINVLKSIQTKLKTGMNITNDIASTYTQTLSIWTDNGRIYIKKIPNTKDPHCCKVVLQYITGILIMLLYHLCFPLFATYGILSMAFSLVSTLYPSPKRIKRRTD